MLLNRQTPPRRIFVTRLAIAGAFVVGLGITSWARAQAPEPKTLELQLAQPDTKRDDPKARALFDEVSKAYKALSSYSDQGQFIVAMTIAGKSQKQEMPLKMTLVRPNKLDLDAGQVRVVCDGTTLTTSVIPLKRYTTAGAPPKIGFDTLGEGSIGAVLMGGPTSAPMFVLLHLLTSTDPVAAIAQIGGSFQPAAAGSLPQPADAAKPAKLALRIDLDKGRPDILLTVDPATKLLATIDLKIDPAQLGGGALAGQNVSIEKFGWTAGAVTTEIAKDRSFAYEAPKGFAKVDAIFERPEAQAATDNKLGKPAPNFTLTLLDGPAKTKTVTKAELAGKVVVIDFWATWCGPCMMELPEIQQLIDSYAESKKDVVVVALSQDDNPSELTAVRKLVEKTLTEKKINLTGSPAGWIGLDPSKSVGTAFEIEGYPTLVILDGKGIVQSVHVGFNPEAAEPLHKTLAKEIDTLLAGKSLAGTHAKAKDTSKKDAK